MSVTGAGCSQEHKNTKFVWDLRKTGFCKGRFRRYDFCLRLLWVTSMCLRNIHYARDIGTECVQSYTGYHIPPNIIKCEITANKIRFHCFKAMSLVRLAHCLFSRRVSFWFSGVCMILGQFRFVFHLIVCGHFLSLFALGSAPLTVLFSCSPLPCWN